MPSRPRSLERYLAHLNWDDGSDRERILRRDLPDARTLIFDELQKFRGWRDFLKGLFDKRRPGALEDLCHLLKWCHHLEDTAGRDVELRYFRDRDGREVDFVVLEDRKPVLFLEVKRSVEPVSKALLCLRELL